MSRFKDLEQQVKDLKEEIAELRQQLLQLALRPVGITAPFVIPAPPSLPLPRIPDPNHWPPHIPYIGDVPGRDTTWITVGGTQSHQNTQSGS
jgi:hypothetical protein